MLHKCDVKLCVNPLHLFIGTHKDNADDKIAKGRHPVGEVHTNAKLTEEQVLDIRSRCGQSQSAMAKEFDIAQTLVSRIRSGKAWPHLGTQIAPSFEVCSGEANGRAKITLEQVYEIRTRQGSLRQLANDFGISKTQVRRITSGESWSMANADT